MVSLNLHSQQVESLQVGSTNQQQTAESNVTVQEYLYFPRLVRWKLIGLMRIAAYYPCCISQVLGITAIDQYQIKDKAGEVATTTS